MPTKLRTDTLLPNRQLGKAIKAHRTKLGLSMRAFAEKAGIDDFSLILRIEAGKDVRYSAVRRILSTYDIERPQGL